MWACIIQLKSVLIRDTNLSIKIGVKRRTAETKQFADNSDDTFDDNARRLRVNVFVY